MDFRISSQPVQMTKKTSFAGTVFEAVFFIALIIIGYIYLVSPKQKEHADLKARKVTLEDQRNNLERQKSIFDGLVRELKANPDSVKIADSVLPLDNRPSQLYLLIENLTQSAGLSSAVATVATSPAVPVAGQNYGPNALTSDRTLTKTVVGINATGTMQQLQNLFTLLETSNRIIQVKTLEISQGNGDQLIFKIGAESYSYLPTKK